MKHRPSLIFCLAAAVACGACSPKPPASEQEPRVVLAKVGSAEILPMQLTAEAERRLAAGQPVPEKAALLAEMAGDEALVQRALAAGLDQDAEVRRAWRSLMIGTLKSRELEPHLREVVLSPEEIQAAYERERDSFSLPARARAAMVFVSKPLTLPDSAKAVLKARIEEARALALSGPDGFQQAALQYSEHQGSRYKGGDIGWLEQGRAPHRISMQVVDAVFAMPAPGGVSETIEAEEGYYIVTRLELKPASVLSLKEVEGKVRARLLRERREQIVDAFDESTRRLVSTEIFPETLKKVVLPATLPPESTPPALPRTADN